MNISDYKYGRYTVGQRLSQMLGKDLPPFLILMRLAVIAAAFFTASDPSASYYIAPHYWIIGVILYYWYPS